jgi:hypothetical protein
MSALWIRFTSSKEGTENFTVRQKSACNPGGPPIEERSRPTGTPLPSDAPQAAKTTATVSLTHPKSGQTIVAVPGISGFRRNSEAPEKKLLTETFERTISRLRRRRRAHRPGPLDQSKAFAADLENDTGQEPGSPGECSVSLFLIVGENEGTCGRRSTVRDFRFRAPWLKPKLICLNTTKHTGFLPVR